MASVATTTSVVSTLPQPSHTASTAVYIPPLEVSITTGAGTVPTSSVSSYNPNPTTPALIDDLQWIETYLEIHQMSSPSYRYAYLLWISVVLFVLIFGVLHWTGATGGFFGAWWSKWAIRRRTWRTKHTRKSATQSYTRIHALPSNAQLLSVFFLVLGPLLLCVLGPDYIAPGTHVWDLSHNLTARSYYPRDAPLTAATSPPDYTIAKAWWTAGGRTGIIAFSLFPLVVLLSLKAPPLALFALSFLTQIHFDKLARLHRWGGMLIWFITAAHVATWTVQLSRDPREGGSNRGDVAIDYVLLYDKFIYAIIAFGCLTLLTLLSIRPIRVSHYEFFYYIHVLLVVATLVFSALHYPPLWWWCWGALLLWFAERSWRLVRFIWVNALFVPQSRPVHASSDSMEMGVRARESTSTRAPLTRISGADDSVWMPEGSIDTFVGDAPDVDNNTPSRSSHAANGSDSPSSPFSPSSPSSFMNRQPQFISQPQHSFSNHLPPPGFAFAHLLAGKTVRMTLVTSRPFTWAPGQHVLLNVPAISTFTTHPFTIASVSDKQSVGHGREIILLIRARRGFTLRLWEEVLSRSLNNSLHSRTEGVILRAYVDGPFGSSVRARWGAHSTVVIVAGGSGVSFGVAVLEYLCRRIAGRHLTTHGGGLHRSKFVTERVRFVWLVREYAHLQWCATSIRRCMDMVPRAALQVDLFVTNTSQSATSSYRPPPPLTTMVQGDYLAPPVPHYAKSKLARSNSMDSLNSVGSSSSIDRSYGDLPGSSPDHDFSDEEQVLDLTNFDGEDDARAPGEAQLSINVKKEGRLRRALSRRVAGIAGEKSRPDDPNLQPPSYPPSSHRIHNPGSPNRPTSHETRLKSLPSPLSPGDRELSSLTETAVFSNPSLYGHYPSVPSGSYDPSRRRDRLLANRFSVADSTYSHTTLESKRTGGAESVRALLNDEDLSYLHISEEEAGDLNIISELARTGKPKLDRLLADEVERAKGAIAVACCGPKSLNTVVRKIVAAQIDPGRVRKGDARGTITLVNEDFEW